MIKLKPDTRIKCNSEDEAKEFIKLAYKQGFKWNDGTSKDNFTAWDKSDDYKIYFLNNDMTITFSKRNYSFFTENLINYSDLKKGDYVTMTKKDLENGMVVETRNNIKYLVHNDQLIREHGHMNLNKEIFSGYYNEDLTRDNNSNYDIVRVYKSKAFGLEDIFDESYLKLIWEREEQTKLSEKDKKKIKKVLKILKQNCKQYEKCDNCELYTEDGCVFDGTPGNIEIDKLFED